MQTVLNWPLRDHWVKSSSRRLWAEMVVMSCIEPIYRLKVIRTVSNLFLFQVNINSIL